MPIFWIMKLQPPHILGYYILYLMTMNKAFTTGTLTVILQDVNHRQATSMHSGYLHVSYYRNLAFRFWHREQESKVDG